MSGRSKRRVLVTGAAGFVGSTLSDRLLADGVAVDAEAPAPLGGGQPMAGLGQMFPGGLSKIAMTPLLAAIVTSKSSRHTNRPIRGLPTILRRGVVRCSSIC